MFRKKTILSAGASVLASLAGFSARISNPPRYSDKIGPDGTRYDPTRTTSKRTKREHQAHNTRKKTLPAQRPIPLRHLHSAARKRLAAQGFVYAMPVHGGYEGWAKS